VAVRARVAEAARAAVVVAQAVRVRRPAVDWMKWMTIFRSERDICR